MPVFYFSARLVLISALAAAGAAFSFGAEPVRAPPMDTIAERVRACTACHGKEGRATSEGYYPRIAGKPAGYLYHQLLNFRDGRRRNATMTYLVANLPDAYLREIAEYFSAQHPPYAPPPAADATQPVLERGRQLAISGDAAKNIPACAACHGNALTGVEPALPGLLGLPRDYLKSQFGAWQIGTRHAATPDCMADVARRLTAEDLSAVIAYLAAQPVPANAAPAASAAGKPPLECGSIAPPRIAP